MSATAQSTSSKKDARLDRFRGCLLGAMVGDSLGMRFDGMDRGPIAHRFADLDDLVAQSPGSYGAATEMTAAVGASLVFAPNFNGDDMAARLLSGWSPSRGYGQGTSTAFAKLKSGIPWRDAGTVSGGRSSSGNGAATRAAPVGLLYANDAEMLRWVAEEQASITHAHAIGSEGAVLQAMAVAIALSTAEDRIAPDELLLDLGSECQIRELREQYQSAAGMALRKPQRERVVARLGNSRNVLGSVVTAAYCFAINADSFENTIAYAISLAGNTAAIASMSGAIAGAHLGLDAIPTRWIESLEQGAVNSDSMRALADDLAGLDTPR
jgi:poly(ADP-ribose) glycohydrolase ARH3